MKAIHFFSFCIITLLAFANPQMAHAGLNPVQPTTAKKAMTKQEVRQQIRQLRKEFRQEKPKMTKAERKAYKARYKAQIKEMKKAPKQTNSNTIIAVIVAIFIPFIGVLIFEGGITKNFWIDLILTLLFFLPGLIYALLIIGGVI